MNNVLAQLEPKSVFGAFEEISQIPRGSGNEMAISNYLVDFAKKHNLEVMQDKAYNVVIRKPGTKGYENAPAVIIQGHIDMVCEKNNGRRYEDKHFEKVKEVVLRTAQYIIRDITPEEKDEAIRYNMERIKI